LARRSRKILALVALSLGSVGWSPVEAMQPVEEVRVNAPTSEEALELARWVIASRDNGELPFIVIDKVAAEVLAYDAEGQLLGFAPALLGIAHGDDATPGIGDRELNEIGPAERTTPAGRFLAQIGPAKGSQKVLWVDFTTSVALHPVITTNPRERRLQRLQSPTPKDNRITFGCINVPPEFYNDVVGPLFAGSGGMVYILPESKFLIEVFPAFHMFAPPLLRSAGSSQPGG